MTTRIALARLAPTPSGTPRRSVAGSSTTSTSSPPVVCCWSLSHVPLSRRVSPARSVSSVPSSGSPARCTASTTRSPLGVAMPGNRCCPMSGERGGTTTSATPRPAPTSSVSSGRAYCARSVLGEVAEVLREGGRHPVGQEPLPDEHDDEQRPDEQRHAGEGELEEPEGARAGIRGRVADDDVHRGAGQREHRAGVRGEGQRHEHLRRAAARPGSRRPRRRGSARRRRR